MIMYSVLLQAPVASSSAMNFLFPVILIAVFFFLIWKPQRDQQKKLDAFRNSLNVGDKVLSSGGIYGKVKEIKGDVVSVEVARDVVVDVARFSLNPVQENTKESKDAKK